MSDAVKPLQKGRPVENGNPFPVKFIGGIPASALTGVSALARDFWYLPGTADGITAYSGTNASASLVMETSTNATKGPYYLNAGASANFDIQTAAAGNAYRIAVNAEASLLDYWYLDDDYTDSKGSNDGSGVSTPTFVSAKINNGMSVSGGSHMQVNNSATLDLQEFTMMFWVKFNATSTQLCYDYRATAGTFNAHNIHLIASKISCRVDTSGGSPWNVILDADSAISTGTWYHVAFTVKQGAQILYVDGVAQTDQETDTGFTVSYAGTAPMRFGSSSGGTNPLNGVLDEVAYFSTALSGATISTIANAATGSAGGRAAFNITNSIAGDVDLDVQGSITLDDELTIESETVAGFLKNDANGLVSGGNSIDISDDTNLTAGTGITLTDDTLSTNDSEIDHGALDGLADGSDDHPEYAPSAGKIEVVAGITAIVGKVYPTIATALTYIGTQSPTETNRFTIHFSGTNAESFTMLNWTHIVGTGIATSRLTGTVTAAVAVAGELTNSALQQCSVDGVINAGAGTYIGVYNCEIAGGTGNAGLTGTLNIYNSVLTGGDYTNFASMIITGCIVSQETGGTITLPVAFAAYSSTILTGSLVGGTFRNSNISASMTLGTGDYVFYTCSLGVSTATVLSGDTWSLYNCTGVSGVTTITVNSGGTLNTVGGDSIDVSNSGTWNNDGVLSTNNANIYIGDTGTTALVGQNLVMPKTTNVGIKVDTATPTFGFRDLIGDMKTRPAAGQGALAVPDYAQYRGTIYGYRFGTLAPNNHIHEAFVEFHIPHDYVPGTDIFLHLHWSQIVVDTGGAAGVPGVAEWFWDVTYSKGYGTAGGAGDPFIAPITTTCLQQGSTTQYGHMICEVQLSAASPSGSQLDSDNLEVDGLLLVRIYRTPGAGNDTLDQNTFVHYCDIHYQSTNMATKDKNTPFYT